MARRRRATEPLDTRHGVLTTYAEIDRYLSAGEIVGRRWIFERAQDPAWRGQPPSDYDVLDLHRVMFADLFAWAGTTRLEDRGPGGRVPVPWHRVRLELRAFTDDLAAWVAALGADPALEDVAALVADAHYRFEWIHPFHDTNGRTGRVLDHYLLWVTFDLAGTNPKTAPVIEYFPTAAHEDEYYGGLLAAEVGDIERLRAYYTARCVAAFGSMA